MQIKAFKLGVLMATMAAGAASAQTPGPFTAAQASAGHATFLENCASCHGKAMAGGGEAPPLVGSAFLNSWGKRGADEHIDQPSKAKAHSNSFLAAVGINGGRRGDGHAGGPAER